MRGYFWRGYDIEMKTEYPYCIWMIFQIPRLWNLSHLWWSSSSSEKHQKIELLFGHCHQNSGQKQLASDMKIEKKASKSGASAS